MRNVVVPRRRALGLGGRAVAGRRVWLLVYCAYVFQAVNEFHAGYESLLVGSRDLFCVATVCQPIVSKFTCL